MSHSCSKTPLLQNRTDSAKVSIGMAAPEIFLAVRLGPHYGRASRRLGGGRHPATFRRFRIWRNEHRLQAFSIDGRAGLRLNGSPASFSWRMRDRILPGRRATATRHARGTSAKKKKSGDAAHRLRRRECIMALPVFCSGFLHERIRNTPRWWICNFHPDAQSGAAWTRDYDSRPPDAGFRSSLSMPKPSGFGPTYRRQQQVELALPQKNILSRDVARTSKPVNAILLSLTSSARLYLGFPRLAARAF